LAGWPVVGSAGVCEYICMISIRIYTDSLDLKRGYVAPVSLGGCRSALFFGLWRVCFPPCLVRPGRRLPVRRAGTKRRALAAFKLKDVFRFLDFGVFAFLSFSLGPAGDCPCRHYSECVSLPGQKNSPVLEYCGGCDPPTRHPRACSPRGQGELCPLRWCSGAFRWLLVLCPSRRRVRCSFFRFVPWRPALVRRALRRSGRAPRSPQGVQR